MPEQNESTDASKKSEQPESASASTAENEAASGVVAESSASGEEKSGANPSPTAPVAVKEAFKKAQDNASGKDTDPVQDHDKDNVSSDEDKSAEGVQGEGVRDTASKVSTTKGSAPQEGQGGSQKPVKKEPLTDYPFSSDAEEKVLGGLESVQFIRDMRAGHIGSVNLLQKMKRTYFKKGEIVKLPLDIVQVLVDQRIILVVDDEGEPVTREQVRLHNVQDTSK